ncbi:MAG: EscU/YscU/HrcU family type III secretion system export apparatus switch protein [Planctomycetaceae bacterium]
MADTADRTLPATPSRREAARRSGAGPTAVAPAWAAAALTTILLGPAWLAATVPAAADLLRAALPAAATREPDALPPAAVWLPTVGVVLAAACAGLAVRLLLDGFSWQPGRAAPDLRRIDPLGGLARIRAVRTLVACLGQAIALTILVVVAIRAAGPLAAVAAAGGGLDDAGPLAAAAWRPLTWLAGATALVALAQWALARRRFEAAIRMTPQEFADESRGLQADPKVRLLHWQRPRGPVRPAAAAAGRSRSGP